MPELTIIAGCNGSGRSSTGYTFIPKKSLVPFDYDMTTAAFEEAANYAIRSKTDFCYETNFETHATFWAEKFKTA